jgi:hypothetical protein
MQSHCVPAHSIKTGLNRAFGNEHMLPARHDRIAPFGGPMGSMARCKASACEHYGHCEPDQFKLPRPTGVRIPQELDYKQTESEDACLQGCAQRGDCRAAIVQEGMCKSDQNADQAACEEGKFDADHTYCAHIQTQIPPEAVKSLAPGRARVFVA